MTEPFTRRIGRLRPGRHLSDPDLLALIERAAGHGHLARCNRCALRHAELLCARMDERAADPEAEAAFDEPRLARQRAHVLRRLERNHGPARVLPFPAAAQAAPGLATIRRRWVAAAAIGGLTVGIFTGGLLRHRGDAETLTTSRRVESTAANGAILPADFRGSAEERLLAELEDAVIARPRAAELDAIDELTPVAR